MNQSVEDMLVSQVGALIGHVAQLEYRVALLEGESREVAADRVRDVVERLTTSRRKFDMNSAAAHNDPSCFLYKLFALLTIFPKSF